jgi:hypothetical protein
MRRRGGCLRYVAHRFPPTTRRPALRFGANSFLVATAVFSVLAWRGVLFPAHFPAHRDPPVRTEAVLRAAPER